MIKIVAKTIAVGESMTEGIPQNEQSLVGITTGSVLTAGALTFLGSLDEGSTYHSIYRETAELSVTTASYTRAFTLTPEDFYGWTHIKIREGNSASAVLQATYDANILLAFRNM